LKDVAFVCDLVFLDFDVIVVVIVRTEFGVILVLRRIFVNYSLK
jgi:hypothetical protein